ncbi:MAG: hypothetical protein HZB70_02315 [Candidatus Berkelbacteria bacterium]|nr:MAG: hypothetical protein HZB70_02315 [Candidatus Berkelbacteria bacterium]
MGEPTLADTYPTIIEEGSHTLDLASLPLGTPKSELLTQPRLTLEVTEQRKLSRRENFWIGLLAAWEVLWQLPNIPQEASRSDQPRFGFWVELKISLLAAWEVFVWLMLYVGTSKQEEMDPSRRD